MDSSEFATQLPSRALGANVESSVEDALAEEQTQRPDDAAPHAAETLEQTLASNQIGRFALLRRIGVGSMGVIYAAYDDVLDRKIAIKLVLPHIAASDRARDRVLREAQALARLRHTNVVQVYDAGVEGTRLFIAMEFVQGQTLRQWTRERGETRSWREVLDVYIQAGRGLAAAHAAGLVHRDFKPDNAMLGEDGVVRVMDFGLARPGATPGPSEHESPASDLHHDLDATHADQSARAGTPAYMAPEQWGEGVIDARADQFSFCVAMFEALWDRRPFEADSVPALAAAVIEGRYSDVSSASDVPEHIRRALRRGLRSDPDERWPSMDALLDELTERSPRGRRAAWLAGGVTLALATAVALVADSDRSDPCASEDQSVAKVWSAERRQAVRSGLESIDAGYSADTAARLDVLLDDYARALAAARRDACEATLVRRQQSEEIMLRRMRCLNRSQSALAAQLELLAEPDAQVLERAIDLAHRLPPVTQCADLMFISADVPPPATPQMAAEVKAIQEQTARVNARLGARKLSEALPLAEQLVEQAKRSGYEPAELDSLITLAKVHIDQDQPKTALELTREAYVRLDGASEPTAIETYKQMGVALTRLGRYEDAAIELQRALALDERTGTQPRRRTAQLHNEMALLLTHQGRPEDAMTEWLQALEIWKLGSDRSPELAIAYNNMGTTYVSNGQYDKGLAMLRDALAIRVETLGPNHPRVGITHSNIAVGLQKLGLMEDATASHREALDILRVAYGDQHTLVARVRDNLGTSLRTQGRFAEALVEHERAQEFYASTSGIEPGYVVDNHMFIGVTLRQMKQNGAALSQYREGLTLAREHFDPDHIKLADLHDNIGVALHAQGEHEAALDEHRAARAIRQRRPEHPMTILSHVYIAEALHALGRDLEAQAEVDQALPKQLELGDGGRKQLGRSHELLARIHLALGNTEHAVAHAEQALELRMTTSSETISIANARFTLARVLWETGTDRRRARGHARQSTELLRELGASHREDLATIDRWLREHPLPSQ